MPGKLDRARFAAARAELKANLELAQLLTAAPAELFEDHAAVTQVALRALAGSAEAYVDASEAMGYQAPAGGRSELLAGLGETMSTEELMRLSTDEVAPGIPERLDAPDQTELDSNSEDLPFDESSED